MTLRGPLGVGLLSGVLLVGWGGPGVPARAADGKGKTVAPGTRVPASDSLRDLHGNRRALHDFKGHTAVVLVFLGAECPVSNLVLPGLVELEKKARGRGVQFLAVYPNDQEDLD